jgi:phosphatidate cytidylyltransferase
MTDWITHRVGLAPAIGWRFDVLGLSVGGRALYLAVLAAALLALTAPLALRIGGEIRTRWITWAMILPVVGIPIWTGRVATTTLAMLLAVGAVLEYARLARLQRADTVWLLGCAIGLTLGTLPSQLGAAGTRGVCCSRRPARTSVPSSVAPRCAASPGHGAD